MGVLNPDGTPYISGDILDGLEHRRLVKPIRRDAEAALRRMAGVESGSAKRRRKAIERREFWTNKKEQQ